MSCSSQWEALKSHMAKDGNPGRVNIVCCSHMHASMFAQAHAHVGSVCRYVYEGIQLYVCTSALPYECKCVCSGVRT